MASPVWYRFENGLPRVMVWDMAIDRGFSTLAVFTRGRGAWAWPLPSGPIDIIFQDGFEVPCTNSRKVPAVARCASNDWKS